MRKTLLALAALALSTAGFGQARLVFNNSVGPVYMVFDTIGAPTPATPAYLVVENSNPNAITMMPPAGILAQDDGSIVSEEEFNFVRWKGIASTVGTYYMPLDRKSTR